MHSNKTATFDALEEFLNKERQAILNGSLKDMGRIAKEKEMLLNHAEIHAPDRKSLDRIHHKAEHNQYLLAAAIRAVRTVSDRLETLRNGPGDLNTYDKSGHRKILGARGKNLHRRA